ncbi:MAG TPA: hypothetical protein V6C85_00215 [Allocoleopsis sp.]
MAERTELLGRAVEKGKKGFISTHSEPRGEAIALRLPISLDEKVRAAAGWTPVEGDDKDPEVKLRKQYNNSKLRKWLESALSAAVEDGGETLTKVEPETTAQPGAELSPLVLDAINDSLEKKRIAIARERKAKPPNQKLIEEWEAEIEELERFL